MNMNRRTRIISMLIAIFVIATMIAPVALASRSAFGVVTNDSFEDKAGINTKLAPWKLKGGSGDKIVCGDKAPDVQHGQCAFMFQGSTYEAAKLSQPALNIDMMNGTLPYTGGSISLSFGYYSRSAASKLAASVSVVYTMPGSPEPFTAKSQTVFTGKSMENGSAVWQTRSVETPVVVPQGATVLSATIAFKNMSTGGKLYIDEVYAVYLTN